MRVGTFLALYNSDSLRKYIVMHELSIAQNIVEIIQQRIPESEWKQVTTVRVKVGTVAGIVPDSLKFSFQAITAESALCNARLITERIPFRIHCRVCNTTTENEDGFAICGECESTDIQILSGTELHIVEIELEETTQVI
jgi:hydrogenase nickel incorporation protein HypA/HybF